MYVSQLVMNLLGKNQKNHNTIYSNLSFIIPNFLLIGWLFMADLVTALSFFPIITIFEYIKNIYLNILNDNKLRVLIVKWGYFVKKTLLICYDSIDFRHCRSLSH